MNKKMTLMAEAEKYCEAHGLRLTAPRLYVLQVLQEAQAPLGAYDILEKLGDYIVRPKPPTAYRALDFWREHGFAHKIESLNAYVSCCTGHAHHDTRFIVCDGCRSVEELHSHAVPKVKLPDGFIAKGSFTEIHGICGNCSASDI